MTYSAPELLLVGAAQNLVLGPDPDTSFQLICEVDNPEVPVSDTPELW